MGGGGWGVAWTLGRVAKLEYGVGGGLEMGGNVDSKFLNGVALGWQWGGQCY